MNYKKIKLLYPSLLFLGLLFRVISTVYTIDGRTGFINPDFYVPSIILNLLSVLCIIFVAVAVLYIKTPEIKYTGPGIISAVIAFFVAVLSVIDMLSMKYTGVYPAWQVAVVRIAGILNAVFFLYFAVCAVLRVKIIPITYIAPLIFCIVKLVRFFAVTSSITIITDNVFTILAYAFLIFFFLEYAFYVNRYMEDFSLKKMIVYGVLASMFSVISALPRIIKLAVDQTAIMHESSYSIAITLLLGVFSGLITVKFFTEQ